MFPCTKCGLCCKNLHANHLYKELDRGDGVCFNFDEPNNLCLIYENRPLICRIDEMHEILFNELDKKEYINLNIKHCQYAQIAANLPSEQIIKPPTQFTGI